MTLVGHVHREGGVEAKWINVTLSDAGTLHEPKLTIWKWGEMGGGWVEVWKRRLR